MGISNDAQREVDEFGAASAELKMFPWDSGYIRWEADSRYALEERIESLEQEVYALRKRNAELKSECRWTPVSEPPEVGKPVLVLTVDGEITSGMLVPDGWTNPRFDFREGEITHWMPLPEPPVSEVVE